MDRSRKIPDGLTRQQRQDLATVRAALDHGKLHANVVRALLLCRPGDVLPVLARHVRASEPP